MKCIRQMFLCLICLTLVACGGSSSEVPSATINASNVTTIVATAMLSGIPMVPEAPYFDDLIELGIIPTACDVGTLAVVHNDLDGDGVWGDGEDISIVYSQCGIVDPTDSSTFSANGEISLSNVNLTGVWPGQFVGDYSKRYDISMTNLELSFEGIVAATLGGVVHVEESSVASNRVNARSAAHMTFESATLPQYVPGPLASISPINTALFNATINEDWQNPENDRITLVVDASNLADSVTVVHESMGTDEWRFTLTAADGSSAVATYPNDPYINNPALSFNVDENGDGVYESTVQTTFDDMGIGGFDFYLILFLVGMFVVSRKVSATSIR